MDKTILNKYKKPEEKLLLSKTLDKFYLCDIRNQIQISEFLDLAQQELIRKFLQHQKKENYLFFGGWEEAERKVLIVYPKKLRTFIERQNINFEGWITALRLTLPNENKGKYTHQNYLGAVMKLGIKREKIGDILVEENGADIIIKKDIFIFLQNNLLQLTRFQKAKIEQISLQDLRKAIVEKEQKIITISSMRLDNIIAELAKCSRSKANEIIQQERVFLNFELTTKQIKEIKQNDQITIRGKGRFYIKQILGNTKKGKIMLQVEMFVT